MHQRFKKFIRHMNEHAVEQVKGQMTDQVSGGVLSSLPHIHPL